MTGSVSIPLALERLFTEVEQAIEANAKLSRVSPVSFTISRDGWGVSVMVKLKGSRKRPSKIYDIGDNAEEAIRHLLGGLDHWAEAIR